MRRACGEAYTEVMQATSELRYDYTTWDSARNRALKLTRYCNRSEMYECVATYDGGAGCADGRHCTLVPSEGREYECDLRPMQACLRYDGGVQCTIDHCRPVGAGL